MTKKEEKDNNPLGLTQDQLDGKEICGWTLATYYDSYMNRSYTAQCCNISGGWENIKPVDNDNEVTFKASVIH